MTSCSPPLQQISELDLIRHQMSDAPLLFAVFSQDYMSTRRPLARPVSQNLGTMSLIYDQLCKTSYLIDADFTSSTFPSPSSISPHDNPELNPELCFNYTQSCVSIICWKLNPICPSLPSSLRRRPLWDQSTKNFGSNVQPTVKSELSELYLEYLSPSSISRHDISQLNHLHSLVCTIVPLSELSTNHLQLC